MRVISFDLSHTLTAKPAARTLIQCTSCYGLPKAGGKQAENAVITSEQQKHFKLIILPVARVPLDLKESRRGLAALQLPRFPNVNLETMVLIQPCDR